MGFFYLSYKMSSTCDDITKVVKTVPGCLMYDKKTRQLYYSTDRGWTPMNQASSEISRVKTTVGDIGDYVNLTQALKEKGNLKELTILNSIKEKEIKTNDIVLYLESGITLDIENLECSNIYLYGKDSRINVKQCKISKMYLDGIILDSDSLECKYLETTESSVSYKDLKVESSKLYSSALKSKDDTFLKLLNTDIYNSTISGKCSILTFGDKSDIKSSSIQILGEIYLEKSKLNNVNISKDSKIKSLGNNIIQECNAGNIIINSKDRIENSSFESVKSLEDGNNILLNNCSIRGLQLDSSQTRMKILNCTINSMNLGIKLKENCEFIGVCSETDSVIESCINCNFSNLTLNNIKFINIEKCMCIHIFADLMILENVRGCLFSFANFSSLSMKQCSRNNLDSFMGMIVDDLIIDGSLNKFLNWLVSAKETKTIRFEGNGEKCSFSNCTLENIILDGTNLSYDSRPLVINTSAKSFIDMNPNSSSVLSNIEN